MFGNQLNDINIKEKRIIVVGAAALCFEMM
jgi:hypothetical protein